MFPVPSPRAFVAALLLALPVSAIRAEEFALPDSAEVESYPPDVLRFYSAGVAALDKVDEYNAYNNLALAANLRPSSVKLNMLAATLALKKGRMSVNQALAKPFYAAAMFYGNTLASVEIEPPQQRLAVERLRIVTKERDDLEQRDAIRDVRGLTFVKELNRRIAAKAFRDLKSRKQDEAAADKARNAPSGLAAQFPGVVGVQPGADSQLPGGAPGLPSAPPSALPDGGLPVAPPAPQGPGQI